MSVVFDVYPAYLRGYVAMAVHVSTATPPTNDADCLRAFAVGVADGKKGTLPRTRAELARLLADPSERPAAAPVKARARGKVKR